MIYVLLMTKQNALSYTVVQNKAPHLQKWAWYTYTKLL